MKLTSYHYSNPQESIGGIEPPIETYQVSGIPFTYTDKVAGLGFEPRVLAYEASMLDQTTLSRSTECQIRTGRVFFTREAAVPKQRSGVLYATLYLAYPLFVKRGRRYFFIIIYSYISN